MKGTTKHLHLICSKCTILLDCDWMGISIDYDDDCLEGEKHIQKEVECDCEQLAEQYIQTISTKVNSD